MLTLQKPVVNRYAEVEELEYDSLRDPHLKAHFSKKPYKAIVIKQGLTTEDGRVIASTKQVLFRIGCIS